MKELKELTKAEDQVMQILWKIPSGFVKDGIEEMHKKFYLNILIKGYFNGSFQNLVSFFAKESKMNVQDLEKLLEELKNQKS